MKQTIYRLKDGDQVVASSPADFARKLHEGSLFDSQGTDEEYMAHFASRLHHLDGSHVRTDSPGHFLDDLLSVGFVSIQ